MLPEIHSPRPVSCFRNLLPWLIAFLLLVVYLLFPNHNSSIDSVAYASDIKYGEELFVPHHLFYNITGYFFINILDFAGIHGEVLALMKVFNALLAFLCLVIFLFILKEMKKETREASGILFIAGVSFGFWRFAVENEVYILPVFLSLVSSFFFIRYFHTKKIIFTWLSGLFGAIACLYHQIHFFWWLGLLVGLALFERRLKTLIYYFLPALLVPLVYGLVIVFYHHLNLTVGSFIHYIFSDYYSGNIVRHIGRENFFMEFISLARTFLQVHGNILLIFNSYPFWLKISSLFILFILLIIMTRVIFWGIKKSRGESFIISTFLLVFALQFIFAFFSIGNAEFMVMLPFVLLIIFFSVFRAVPLLLYLAGFFMLTWNFLFAVYPGNKFQHSRPDEYISIIKKDPENLYILTNKGEIETWMYYENKTKPGNLYDPPSYLVSREKGMEGLEKKISEYLSSGKKVFTNCLDEPQVFSRKSYLEKSKTNQEYFSRYKKIVTDTIHCFEGNYYLTEISIK